MGIDPARLRVAPDVLRELDDLDPDHPDAIALRRATAHVYKSVKLRRRSGKRASITAADEAVTNLTATGAKDRIDDETQGIPLAATAQAQIDGTLARARSRYTSQQPTHQVPGLSHPP